MDVPQMPMGTGDPIGGQQPGGGSGGSGGQKPPDTWADDRNHIIEFLQDLKTIMDYLIKNRIPDEPAALFIDRFPEVAKRIDSAVTQLDEIKSRVDDLYKKLQDLGLTEEEGRLKFREFYEGVTTRAVGEVLHTGDTILGSLCEALFVLEPVKEFKEILESRLKNGGDKSIITSLNIFRRTDWWNKKA
jgi:hypothetical protein